MAISTWRDNLQTASFRGVPFQVESDTRTVGRRNVLHVFPQRNVGAVEDLGRVVNAPLSFTAYVIGLDFLAKRDRLIEALNAGGPGVLVHPLYGKLTVNAGEVQVTTSTAQGGMASFSLAFVESGADPFPAIAPDSGSLVLGAGSALAVLSAARFAARLSVATPSLLTGAAIRLASILADVRREMATSRAALLRDPQRFEAAIRSIQHNSIALLQAPADLAVQLQAVYSGIVDLGVLSRLAVAYAGLFDDGAGQSAVNANAFNRLQAQAVLSAGAFASSQTVYVTYEDADAFRNGFADACDAEQGQSDGDGYAALADLSGAVWADIDARAATLATVVAIDALVPVSSLELAQSLYADATRAAEISGRNGVVHPGFCYGALSVLSA